jgi:hypothetical protein
MTIFHDWCEDKGRDIWLKYIKTHLQYPALCIQALGYLEANINKRKSDPVTVFLLREVKRNRKPEITLAMLGLLEQIDTREVRNVLKRLAGKARDKTVKAELERIVSSYE